MSDWRNELSTALIQICRSQGVLSYSEDAVMNVLYAAADKDRLILKDYRHGFAYVVDEYKDAGLTRFLNLCEKIWDKVMEAHQQINDPPRTFDYRCVVSIKTDKHYDAKAIAETVRDYLIQNTEPSFNVTIAEAVNVYDCWIDLVCDYSKELHFGGEKGLLGIFTLLFRISWVQDVITKPYSQVGQRTLSSIK